MTTSRDTTRRTSAGPKLSKASEQAILEAGENLMLEIESPAEFTIEAVAKRAQAGKPTVYRHWPTKEALFLALAKKVILAIPNRVPDEGTVADQLVVFHQELWGRLTRQPYRAIGRSLLTAALTDAGIRKQLHDEFAALRREAIREILERGIRRGELRLRSDVEVKLAIDLICGFSTYRFILGQPVDEDLIRSTVDLVIGGLSRRCSPALATGAERHLQGAA